MKKRILLILLAIVMTFSLASCDAIMNLVSPPHDTHEFGDIWQADDIQHWQECECGDTYTEVIAAEGHTYVDGTCTVCGAQDGTNVPGGDNTPDTEPDNIPDNDPDKEPEKDPENDVTDDDEGSDCEDPDYSEDDSGCSGVQIGFFGRLWRAIVNFFKNLFGKKD